MADKETQIRVIHTGIVNALNQQEKALPSGFNKQRFVQNCMTVLQDSKSDYSKCEPSTVVRTLLKGAFLGLDFFNGECYAIPYGNNCQFQTDYKGEVKLCKRYSTNPIRDIYAKLVREGDEFEVEITDGIQHIHFKPVPFNNGAVIGAFAVVYYKDDSMIFDTMSVEEMDRTRDVYSKAANSKAWKESPGEMYKKTVLRRICKLIDLNFDTAEQMQAFMDGADFEVDKKPEKKVEEAVDPFSIDEVIDVEAEVVEE